MRTLRLLTFVLTAMALAAAVAAQATVTAADISRLEATAAEVGRQVTALEKTDATLAADVRRQLSDLSDETTYLKVKLRRDGSVTRDEYASLRDRLETLHVRALGQKASAEAGRRGCPRRGAVPVATELDVRLQTPLNSGTSRSRSGSRRRRCSTTGGWGRGDPGGRDGSRIRELRAQGRPHRTPRQHDAVVR